VFCDSKKYAAAVLGERLCPGSRWEVHVGLQNLWLAGKIISFLLMPLDAFATISATESRPI